MTIAPAKPVQDKLSFCVSRVSLLKSRQHPFPRGASGTSQEASDPLEMVLKRLSQSAVTSALERARALFDPAYGGYREVVIFGAGELGLRVLAAARAAGLTVHALADNNEQRWYSGFNGLTIMPPAEAVARFGERATFIVAIYNPSNVRDQLRGLGCEQIATFPEFYWSFSDFVEGITGINLPTQTLAEMRHISRAYELLADARSRQEFASQLGWRCTLDQSFLSAPSPFRDMHLDPELFALSSDETVIDCGAFDGDSLRLFLARSQGRFRRYFALEPDPINRTALERFVASLPERQRAMVSILPYAAGAENKTVGFKAGFGVASSISREAVDGVECRRLDDVINKLPTLIKMDIEGAELSALQGAAGLINSAQPVLSICAYHLNEHLWQLPLLMRQLAPNHQLFFRRYAEDCWETVYYAVPVDKVRPDLGTNCLPL